MKSTRELVFDLIRKEIYANNNNGVETKKIAESLGMQRSNVSAILNELVKEGILIKSDTRPVLYTLANVTDPMEPLAFSHLIGENGSIKKQVQLAKAAILYPKKSLNVLISAKNGCGTTYFVYAMYQFAFVNNVLKNDKPFVKVNCRHFATNISMLNDELFGVDTDFENNAFTRARGGVLFIDHADLLDAKQTSRLMDFLETSRLYSEDKTLSQEYDDVFVILACSPQNSPQYTRVIPVTIELPEIKDRPFKERYDLINQFFIREANNSDCSIVVSTECIAALILHDYTFNIKEIEFEIKAACANAYVRVVNENEKEITVILDDFKGSFKKDVLKSKEYIAELTAIVGVRDNVVYDKKTDYIQKGTHQYDDMYVEIKRQFEELSNRGISSKGIENVINSHIDMLFKRYRYYSGNDETQGIDHLSKIVDVKVIELVQSFISTVSKALGREFKSNVFYGLCLHINSLMNMNIGHQRVSNDQVVKIIQEYPKEYAVSINFAEEIKAELGLELPVEEIIILSMFLIESEEDEEEAKPVLLYILHGNGTATSLKDVTNALTHCHNAYGYDLTLDSTSEKAMEEIKQLILNIDNGAGVVVIYDMGSIKTMLESISEEIDVKIRYMNIPITLVGIDIARKCSMESDIDYVYHMANMEVRNMNNNQANRNEIIVTLCHTGDGGALQLKRYISEYSKLGMKVVALAISDREALLKEVLALQKTFRIHCFVGTYDPKLFGIPFIPIAKVFENSHDDLDRILMFEPISSRSFDYDQVYKHLEDTLKYVSISKLKTVLPDVIDDFGIIYDLTEDQRLGLFMHIACVVERLLDGTRSHEVIDKDKIIFAYKEDYAAITRILKRLEKVFKVIIDENEIATIIMIVKKI